MRKRRCWSATGCRPARSAPARTRSPAPWAPGRPSGAAADCDATLSATLAAAAAGTARDAEWGTVHRAVFSHPILGRLPLLGALARWSIEQPGDDTTLFRGSARGPDWTSVHGPSYRGVYDLADLDRSVFALAPGQSGHPLRHAAGSLLSRWRDEARLRLGPTATAGEVE